MASTPGRKPCAHTLTQVVKLDGIRPRGCKGGRIPPVARRIIPLPGANLAPIHFCRLLSWMVSTSGAVRAEGFRPPVVREVASTPGRKPCAHTVTPGANLAPIQLRRAQTLRPYSYAPGANLAPIQLPGRKPCAYTCLPLLHPVISSIRTGLAHQLAIHHHLALVVNLLPTYRAMRACILVADDL